MSWKPLISELDQCQVTLELIVERGKAGPILRMAIRVQAQADLATNLLGNITVISVGLGLGLKGFHWVDPIGGFDEQTFHSAS